jgi:hypothetical protein
MGAQFSLHIAEDGADAERLDVLTGHLRRELLELDVEDVTAMRTDQVPEGARSFDPATIGALVVSVGSSVTSLKDVVAVVRGWLSRGGRVKRTVKIEIGGDTLELSEATVADQDRLIDMFVRRHAAAQSEPAAAQSTTGASETGPSGGRSA